VPERDARKVMTQLTGIRYKGRQVRCNDAEDTNSRPEKREYRSERREYKTDKRDYKSDKRKRKDDFAEEGWARRRPKKR